MSGLFTTFTKFGWFGFTAVPSTYTSSSPYDLPKTVTEEDTREPKKFRPYRSPPNPGKFEDLSREAKDFLGPSSSGELFDGVRLVFQRHFTPAFTVIHSVSMGQSEPAPPASYNFMAQWARKGLALWGRTDADFNVTARVSAEVTPNLTTKVAAEVSQDGERDFLEVDSEYKGSDWTGSFKYQSHGPIYGVSYSQGISKWFAAGLEAMFVPKMNRSFFAAQVRFTPSKRDVFTAQMSSLGLTEISYVRAVTRQLKVASSLTFAKNEEGQIMSLWSAGYVYDFFSHITVKGSVTQLSEVSVVVDEKLSDAISVSLSGQVNYAQNEYKFGLGASLSL